MRERISELLKSKGLTANKFADIIDIQPSGLSHILNGRNKPGFDFIVRTLERFPDVSPDWLLMGKGEMYREKKHENNYNSATLFDEESEKTATSTATFDDNQRSIITKVLDSNHNKRGSITKIVILNSNKTAQLFDIED